MFWMLVCGKASLFMGWKMLLMKMVTSHLTQTSRDVSSFTHFVWSVQILRRNSAALPTKKQTCCEFRKIEPILTECIDI